MALPLSFRWDEAFVARIDAARKTPLGIVSRSAFVRDAVELAIRHAEATQEMAEDPSGRHARRAVEQALGGHGQDVTRSGGDGPAPAEPPKRSRPLSQYRESDVLPPARSETYPAPRSHAPNCKCPVCS